MAKKEGIDISQVPGTGRNGRVTKGDLLDFLKSGSGTASAAVTPTTAAPVSSGVESSRPKQAPLTGVTDEDT